MTFNKVNILPFTLKWSLITAEDQSKHKIEKVQTYIIYQLYVDQSPSILLFKDCNQIISFIMKTESASQSAKLMYHPISNIML